MFAISKQLPVGSTSNAGSSADIIDYIATPPIRYILTGGVSYFRSCIGCSVSFPILQRCDAVGLAKELDVVRLVIISHTFTQFRNFDF